MVTDFKVRYIYSRRDFVSKVYAVDPRVDTFLVWDEENQEFMWVGMRHCELCVYG